VLDSPAQGTDPVNDNHVLTGHVNVNTGTGGYVSAPAGTTINFAKASGPGTLSAPSCLTLTTTGSCTVTLTSPTVGTTIVNASTDVVVGGQTLHRTTDGVGSNSGSASKTWTATALSTTASGSVTVGGGTEGCGVGEAKAPSYLSRLSAASVAAGCGLGWKASHCA